MSDPNANANYPIVLNGDYKDPIGRVTVHNSTYSELLTHPFKLKPIVGQQTDVVGAPWVIKGFNLVLLPEEQLGIHLPSRTDYGGLENIVRLEHQLGVIKQTSMKETLRKEILLEVIQSITKL